LRISKSGPGWAVSVRSTSCVSASAYATMDAGPHVKALCHADDAERVAKALADTQLVLRTLTAHPGPDLEIRK